jgi:hypothetical protein
MRPAAPLAQHARVCDRGGARLRPQLLTVICAWCRIRIGEKDAEGSGSGISHSVCDACYDEMLAHGDEPSGAFPNS